MGPIAEEVEGADELPLGRTRSEGRGDTGWPRENSCGVAKEAE